MKKLICMLLIAALAVGFAACAVPNTKPIYVGTWVGEDTTLLLNEDGTGTLTTADATYAITWKVHVKDETSYENGQPKEGYASYHDNPDSIDILSVKGGDVDLSTNPVEPNFPILKANLTVTKGMLQLSIFDGNAKDDDFAYVATVDRSR